MSVGSGPESSPPPANKPCINKFMINRWHFQSHDHFSNSDEILSLVKITQKSIVIHQYFLVDLLLPVT